MQMGWNVIRDPVAFAEIKKTFDETKDKNGKTMTEVCKEYWDNKRREGKI